MEKLKYTPIKIVTLIQNDPVLGVRYGTVKINIPQQIVKPAKTVTIKIRQR